MARRRRGSGGTHGPRGRHGRNFAGNQNIGDFFPHLNMPPLGTYDPGIHTQTQQSQLGLLDLLQDIHRSNRQARVDTGFQRRQVKRGARQQRQDIGYQRSGTKLQFTQDLQDLALAQQRGDQDYQLKLEELGRKYTALASGQTQAGNARGLLEGGYAEQAAQKRASNQAFEQQPIDIAHARLGEDITMKRQRERLDFQRAMARYGVLGHRIGQERHSQLAQLARQLHRGLSANRIQRSRGIRDESLYRLGQSQQAFWSAHAQNPRIKFPY